jgi:DNA invertase Pin-like site-specific DNA recombinase
MSHRIAAIYCRISSDPRHEALGVARQEADCRDLCARKGWTIALVLTDNDISAYSGKRRPGYDALIEAVKAGDVDAVVAWHPDRLHRSPKELEAFIDLIDASGAAVATCRAGDYDLTTPTGRMNARIVGAVARHESEHTSQKARRKMDELARSGSFHGGGRAFGYRYDAGRRRLSIVAAEAKIIREMARRLLAGESLRSLVADLNARGVPTVTGVAWSLPTLRGILRSGRIAGLREHRGEIVGAAAWRPIIDAETHRRLRALLDDDRRRKRRAARSYLLTGLLRCGQEGCGAQLHAKPSTKNRGGRTYACYRDKGGCGHLTIAAEAAEAEVVARLLAAADGGELTARMGRQPDDAQVADELAAVEARMAELASMWAAGETTRGEWQAARSTLESRAAALRAVEAAEVRRHATVPLDGLAARWADPAFTFDQRRAILAAAIDHITVAPRGRSGSRFDPERIAIDWRS